jgi:hypothetical protein
MQQMSDVEHLLAIEAIKDLQARRCYAVDTSDWTAYEVLHAPDHVSNNEGESQPYVGGKANAERIKKTHDTYGITSMHHVHSPIITFESPTRARGIWSMEDQLWWTVDGVEHWSHGWGFYHETYEKRDGTWLFTSRQLKRQKMTASPGAKLGNFSFEANPEGHTAAWSKPI